MRTWLEKILTRIPMYLLVNGTLVTLVVVALVLSLAGQLSFEPFELFVTTVLFIISGLVTSYGLGKLYGAPSHLQSALITSLLLALLFRPTLELDTLTHYALISVIAQASKYVVAYKRRHIFNPAAFGAFVGGLLGFGYASWWIGSPPIAPFVAITAFLVLYKTRQLQVALLFVILSIILISVNGVTHGESFLSMGWIAVTSWPLLFLAGFMLSEPLTLPPRRWQKFMVGILVAAITSLPFHTSWFNSSPTFALLVGNLLAFGLAFRQRAGLKLRLSERRNLTPTIQEYVLASDTPVAFEPGQFIELTLPHTGQDQRGIRRSFSIASRPGQKQIVLGIKFYESGSSFKKQLQNVPIGSTIQTTGISGDFILPKNKKQKLLFIAGGIGVTPFISHILSSKTERRDIILLYFIRSTKESAYKDTLDKADIAIHYFTAAETPILTNEMLAKYVPDLSEREAYVSGPPAMVSATEKLLGNKIRRLHTDYFSGY